MATQAVLFDLWQTLIVDRPDVSSPRQQWRVSGVQAALAAAGVEVELEAVGQAVRRTGAAVTAQHDEGRDGGVAGRLALLAAELEASAGVAVPAVAYPALETALCTIPSPYFPQPAPHAVETLQQIKTLGLCTALVSNAGVTTAPTLRRMLEEHGMAPHLDALVFSDEVMVAKPHPVIFGQALRAVGAEAVQAVFVGDSPLNDIGGAQSAGIFAVQVGDKRHDSISPDASIVALDELVGVLRRRGLVATASGAVHD